MESIQPDTSHSSNDVVPEVEESNDIDHTLIKKYESEFSPLDRRVSSVPKLFQDEDSIFKSVIPNITHWSVAWSDLMMTMFILFLSMFVYQAAHKDFLISEEPELVGGATTEALLAAGSESSITNPIGTDKASLMSLGTIKQVVPVNPDDVSTFYLGKDIEERKVQLRKSLQQERGKQIEKRITQQANPQRSILAGMEVESIELEDVVKPPPDEADSQEIRGRNLYADSKTVLEENDLESFAKIQIFEQGGLRIGISADFLFGNDGGAQIQKSAVLGLKKITSAIKNTSYLINIAGHTDNIPLRSDSYASNWELSVSRAAAVARFLINEAGMSPNQFVVSGYASYRPVVPNTNVKNRALNRRVEIVVTNKIVRRN